MTIKSRKQNLTNIAIYFGIFVIFFIFYRVAHPLYIYDTDDWTYISYARHAVPTLPYWNPTRILPETLTPFVSMLGVHIISPLTNGDVIESLAIAFAICLSAFIALYFYMYFRLFSNKFKVENSISVCLTGILILFHFLVYTPFEAKNGTAISYFFFSGNITCIFYYVIPFLINSSIVLYYISNEHLFITGGGGSIKDWIKYGAMLLWIYLCICSNIYHSGILIVWIGTELLFCLIKDIIICNRIKEKGVLMYAFQFIKQNCIQFVIILFWIYCCILDLNGGRAKSLSSESVGFLSSIKLFINSFKSFGLLFIAGSGLVVIAFIIIQGVQKREKKSKGFKEPEDNISSIRNELIIKELTALFVMILYLLLITAKVGAGISRVDVMCCWVWYLILVVFTMAVYIMKKYSWTVILLPLISYILLFETVIDGKCYMDINALGSRNLTVVKELDNSIIEQVLDAQSKGFEMADVYVPYSDSIDGWPIAITYGGQRISDSLYRLGITYKKIDISLIMDKKINEKYGMD